MPDDNQTAASGLMANQPVTEPRSAVEAASDPSHGGAKAIQATGNTYQNPDETHTTVMVQTQGAAAYQAAMQAQQFLASQNAIPPRTMKSGIDRLRGIRDEAEKLASEFHEFVVEIEGGPKKAMSALGMNGSTESSGTAGAIHDAASDLKSVFSRLADLVKRAKAAHG